MYAEQRVAENGMKYNFFRLKKIFFEDFVTASSFKNQLSKIYASLMNNQELSYFAFRNFMSLKI